ncbi:MAG: exo-alpha-sialidase [Candidatus Cryptobacteroides sp.]
MKQIISLIAVAGMSMIACSDIAGETGTGHEKPSSNKKIEVAMDIDLIDNSRKDNLGLPYPEGVQRISVFEPEAEEDMKFNNHPQLVVFKGKLYATWVGHPIHEPSPESWVYYSYSEDGIHWVKPIRVGPDGRASGGWITDGRKLGCLLIAGDKVNKTSNTELIVSEDGLNWSEPTLMITNAAPSESARRLPDGRYIMVCHGLGTGDFAGVRKTRIMLNDTDDWFSSWTEASLPDLLPYNENAKEKVARPVEASWYRRSDGILVMLFRDLRFEAKDRSWKLLYSVSYDNGSTWSMPQQSNIPDSDSMQCAGSFGKYVYFVNNPVPTRRRVPITVGVSRDGKFFEKMYLLRSTPQPRRYEGISKTEGYSYPGSVVWGDWLYVAYATNKEDIEISRIPLKSIKY